MPSHQGLHLDPSRAEGAGLSNWEYLSEWESVPQAWQGVTCWASLHAARGCLGLEGAEEQPVSQHGEEAVPGQGRARSPPAAWEDIKNNQTAPSHHLGFAVRLSPGFSSSSLIGACSQGPAQADRDCD